jgi:hypothetical protein
MPSLYLKLMLTKKVNFNYLTQTINIEGNMPAIITTRDQLRYLFESNELDLDRFLAPLSELTENHSSFIIGYGAAQRTNREELIPYFHVVGPSRTKDRLHALIIGGWSGTEVISGFAVAHLLASVVAKLDLLDRIEPTAFPILNVEAFRQQVVLTPKQELEGVRLWQHSPCSHIRVLEREVFRYPYDLVIILREDKPGVDLSTNVWPGSEGDERALSTALRRTAANSPAFSWQIAPVAPALDRWITPLPGDFRQPNEVIIGLPGALPAVEQWEGSLSLILSLLHGLRQSRQESGS